MCCHRSSNQEILTKKLDYKLVLPSFKKISNVAQRKRAGLITRRTSDRNGALLYSEWDFSSFWLYVCLCVPLNCFFGLLCYGLYKIFDRL